MPETKDVKIAPNIWQTPYGWRVYLCRQGRPIKKRFKRSEYTLEDVQRFVAVFQQETKRLRREPRRPVDATDADGFTSDAKRYLGLKTTQAMPSFVDRRRDIQLWVDVFGKTPRRAITTLLIDQQLQAWRDEGYAASTVNNRRTALMAMFTDLDGPGAANSVRASKVFEEPELVARGIPWADAMKILDAIPAARVYSTKPNAKIRHLRTRPRIELMALTGMRPSQIARLERGVHFSVKDRWYFIPRSKKGSQRKKPRTPRPMTPKHMTNQMAPVFQRFDELDCYTPVGRERHLKSGMRKAFRAAMKVAEQQIRRERRDPTFRFPADLKPYDLRHSFGSEMLVRTNGNYNAVAELLDQADTRHVRRYGLGAIPTILKNAALAFEQGTAHIVRSAPTVAVSVMPRRPKGVGTGKTFAGKRSL